MPQQNIFIGSRNRLCHNYPNGSSGVETVKLLLEFILKAAISHLFFPTIFDIIQEYYSLTCYNVI